MRKKTVARKRRDRKMIVDVLVMVQVCTSSRNLKENHPGITPVNVALEEALDSGALDRAFKRQRCGRIEHAFVIGEESGSRKPHDGRGPRRRFAKRIDP